MSRKIATVADFTEVLPFFDYKRNSFSPDSIAAYGDKKIWWVCDADHSYEASAYNKLRKGQGCPFCANRKVLKCFNDLSTTHPYLLEDWDYDNNTFTPDSIVAGAAKTVYWKCKTCSYKWKSAIAHRGKRNHSCPMCMNRVVKKGLNDVLTTNPEIKELWDFSKNKLNPYEISRGSNKQVWWTCNNGHSLKSNITKLCNGIKCSYCINQKLLTGFNDIVAVRPDLGSQWDYKRNTGLDPKNILISSKKKYFWICEYNHSTFNSPFNRNGNTHSFCKECNPVGGFDGKSEGIFYFIHHKEYRSYKIGIANKTSKRLQNFQSRGWDILRTYNISDGNKVRTLETEMLRWIRKDLKLPIFLGKNEMGDLEGYTETFSDEISEIQIINKVELFVSGFTV